MLHLDSRSLSLVSCVAGRNSTHTQSGGIWDMCLVEEPDRTLLVTTGIFAYNVQKDELEWSIRGKLAGME